MLIRLIVVWALGFSLVIIAATTSIPESTANIVAYVGIVGMAVGGIGMLVAIGRRVTQRISKWLRWWLETDHTQE